MESSWKNIIYGNLRPKKFEKNRNLNPHFFEFSFCIYFLDLFLDIFFEYISSKYFCGDEELKMIHFPLIKSTKAWI